MYIFAVEILTLLNNMIDKTNNIEIAAEKFYKDNVRSKIESVSGYGSFLKNTKEVRGLIEQLIEEKNIFRIVDCPCGDWNWMQNVNLGNAQYMGLDIVQEIVDNNQEKFGSDNVIFYKFNILEQKPPPCDLLICRDLLFHFSLKNMKLAANNLKACHCKYLMSTTFPWVEVNQELTEAELAANWGYRQINLSLPPVNMEEFGKPIKSIKENAACFHRIVNVYEKNN